MVSDLGTIGLVLCSDLGLLPKHTPSFLQSTTLRLERPDNFFQNLNSGSLNFLKIRSHPRTESLRKVFYFPWRFTVFHTQVKPKLSFLASGTLTELLPPFWAHPLWLWDLASFPESHLGLPGPFPKNSLVSELPSSIETDCPIFHHAQLCAYVSALRFKVSWL